MLLQYPYIAVGGEVILQGLELHQVAVRKIANHQPSEVREPCPGADTGELFRLISYLGDRAGILKGEGFQHLPVNSLFPQGIESPQAIFIAKGSLLHL
jgi:hypothetical protein